MTIQSLIIRGIYPLLRRASNPVLPKKLNPKHSDYLISNYLREHIYTLSVPVILIVRVVQHKVILVITNQSCWRVGNILSYIFF